MARSHRTLALERLRPIRNDGDSSYDTMITVTPTAS
jgi:hypothetical protein